MKEIVFHRWTPEMINWLKKNYPTRGDKELAEAMNVLFPHKYKWKIKNVEKRRKYSGFKRTAKQIFKIKSENNKKIDRSKMWDTRGRSPIGKVVKWNHCGGLVEYIKTETGFERLARIVWEIHNGKIPFGYNVVLKDRQMTAAEIGNLILLSNSELATLNSKNRTPDELKESKFLLRELNKIINEKQNFGFKQSPVRAA